MSQPHAAGLLAVVLLLSGLVSAQPARAPQAERYALLFRSLEAPASLAVQAALGSVWRDIGDPAAAQPHWAATLAEEPRVDRVLQLSADLLLLNRTAQAVDVLRLGVGAAPDDIALNAALGMLLAPFDPRAALPHLRRVGMDDRYDDAVLPLVGLLNNAPLGASAGVNAQIGAVLARSGQITLAEVAYRAAAAQQPNFAEALAQVGHLRAQQNRDPLPWINRAVALAPLSPDVRLAQALALRQIGEPDAALAALAIARAYAPQSAVLLLETARTYRQMGLTQPADAWQAQADALLTPTP